MSTVYVTDPAKMAERGIQATNAILQPNADLVRWVAHVVDSGQFKVPIDRTYSLAQTVETLEHSEHDDVRGTLVLTMRGGVPIQQGESLTVSGGASHSRSGE